MYLLNEHIRADTTSLARPLTFYKAFVAKVQ